MPADADRKGGRHDRPPWYYYSRAQLAQRGKRASVQFPRPYVQGRGGVSVSFRKALRSGCVAFLAAGVVLGAAPAHAGVLTAADPSSATVTGHITLSDGSPAAYARVLLWPTSGGLLPETITDPNGYYSFPAVTPREYRLTFELTGGPTFYAPGTVDWSAAQLFTFAAGQTTTVDEQFPATGRLVGHFTDNGQPMSGVSIGGSSPTGESFYAYTGADGSFTVTYLPGSYRMSFRTPDGLLQYAHEKTSYYDADEVTITAGTDTILEEHLAPTGSISGHLSNDDGTPAANATVTVIGANDEYYYASTDGAGGFAVRTFPGRYGVTFANDNERLRYHATTNREQASLVTVSAGQATTVDESFLPTGSLTVTARDAKTHAPLASFCANVDGVQSGQCTDNGTVTFATVGPGTRNVRIYGDGNYGYSSLNTVAVASGQSSSLAIDLPPYSKVKTVVRDSVTGLPVANACIEVITDGNINGMGHGNAGCSDADGNAEVAFTGAGIYKAFVWAGDGVHGDQWVGVNGGVGTTLRAKPIVVKAGETTTIAPIKLDLAAPVTGVVTDKATGAAVANAVVGIATADTGFGGSLGITATDATGHYTLNDLGPYDWPILVVAEKFASVWSGGTGNRFLANGVHLTAGQTTTYNVALGKGTTLTGLVSNQWGPLPGVRIVVINAVTGDNLATADAGGDGRYTVQVFGPQAIKLYYNAYNFGFGYSGWAGGADQAHSTTIVVTGNGTKTANVAATQLDRFF
jgi:hypothetical protein